MGTKELLEEERVQIRVDILLTFRFLTESQEAKDIHASLADLQSALAHWYMQPAQKLTLPSLLHGAVKTALGKDYNPYNSTLCWSITEGLTAWRPNNKKQTTTGHLQTAFGDLVSHSQPLVLVSRLRFLYYCATLFLVFPVLKKDRRWFIVWYLQVSRHHY